MTLQTSSLHVAGQDSDVVDVFLRSSRIPKSLLDAGSSPMVMYGDREYIKSWINAIDPMINKSVSVVNLDDSYDPNTFEFATHPFRTCYPRSPLSDEFESESDIFFPLDASAWAPEVFASTYSDDSDESRSESSLDDAQYVTIPSDSPWYRRPSPSPGPISVYEFTTAAYANSCSNDVRQAIAQQELLLAIFHEELRRALPRDGSAEYDSGWLGDVDADLLLAPLETYAELCWESAVYEKSPAMRSGRPIHVPTGFEQGHESY